MRQTMRNLTRQSTAGSADRPYVTHFVAIDARALLQETGGDGLQGHFVHTRVSVGITDRAVRQQVLKRLRRPRYRPAGSRKARGVPPHSNTRASSISSPQRAEPVLSERLHPTGTKHSPVAPSAPLTFSMGVSG